MEYKWVQNDNTLTVSLKGELDHHSAAQTRKIIDDTVISDKRITRLIIDMRGVTFMDSSGLGVILGRYRLLSSRGGSMQLEGVNRSIDKIFKMSGVYSLVETRK